MSFVIDLRALDAAEPNGPDAAEKKSATPPPRRAGAMATPAERRAYIASLDACGRARAAG